VPFHPRSTTPAPPTWAPTPCAPSTRCCDAAERPVPPPPLRPLRAGACSPGAWGPGTPAHIRLGTHARTSPCIPQLLALELALVMVPLLMAVAMLQAGASARPSRRARAGSRRAHSPAFNCRGACGFHERVCMRVWVGCVYGCAVYYVLC